MKKIIIFLIVLTTSLFSCIQVTAKTQGFYQGEYISNIYFQKQKSNGVVLYSQARFIRKNSTNEIAYCIEPFEYFKDGYIYEGTQTPLNFTPQQIQDMTLISHFGYGYEGHTEAKWYAITQVLIWEVANTSMQYYITPTKNYKDTHLFNEELEELRQQVANYKKETSFNNQTYTIVEGETFSQQDQNNALTNYTSPNNIQLENNTIKVPNLKKGTYSFTLEKEHNLYNKHPLFYTHNETQDVMEIGDPVKIMEIFTINVINTTVKLTKVDSETNKELPQGNASLIDSTFALYKKDNTLIKTLTLTNTTEVIKNLPLGEYYIKEVKPGLGYELNPNTYNFTIDETTPEIALKIPNKVIKGKLSIKKEYGTTDNFLPEQNISFNIYKDDELIQTIITNDQGIAEITLPYGKYKLTQLTTTEGYKKIEPIYFEITSNETIYYNLKDYKIDVPNTKTTSIFSKILLFIKQLLCGKK